MHTQSDPAGKQNMSIAGDRKSERPDQPALQFIDNRPEKVVQRNLGKLIAGSAQTRQMREMQQLADQRGELSNDIQAPVQKKSVPATPVIQRTIWKWNAEGSSWDVFYPTENREEPPFQGIEGDFYDNEGTLGKFDINGEEADRAKEQSQQAAVLKSMPMSEILQLAFAESGIAKKFLKNGNLFNILLDIGLQELKAMHIDDKVMKLPAYYQDSLAYTSCHNTAIKLMERMSTTPDNLGAYTGKDKTEAKAELDTSWMVPVCQGLNQNITGDIGNNLRTIYEVHCGGHGFSIIVRNGTAEIVQSFANAVSLVERMQQGPLIFDLGQIQEVINGLGSAIQEERDFAANVIASCDAEVFGLVPDKDANSASYQFRWRRQLLLSDTVLLDNFKVELKAAFLNIRNLLGM